MIDPFADGRHRTRSRARSRIIPVFRPPRTATTTIIIVLDVRTKTRHLGHTHAFDYNSNGFLLEFRRIVDSTDSRVGRDGVVSLFFCKGNSVRPPQSVDATSRVIDVWGGFGGVPAVSKYKWEDYNKINILRRPIAFFE